MNYIETDPHKRQWNTPKDKIEHLADLMNEQSVHPLQTSDELFYIFDAALSTEEVDFLLSMGGGTHSRQELHKKTGLDQKEFDRILHESERYNRHGALMFIDLDHFKLVNDTSGHQAGDTLLRAVAESMKSATRDSDLLARLGGDEFALVIPEASHQEAMLVSQKIMNNLNKIDLPSAFVNYKPSGSIGVTLFPEHGTNIQELMGNADIAMYQAKQKGRGICHMFSINEHAREQITQRIQWKNKIEHALKNDRFILHYQPILNISKNNKKKYKSRNNC